MNDGLRHEPAFAGLFISHLLSLNIRANRIRWINTFTQAGSDRRGCSSCWRTLEKRAKPEPVISKIGQDMLVDTIRTRRSGVRFLLNTFRKLGFIGHNGG